MDALSDCCLKPQFQPSPPNPNSSVCTSYEALKASQFYFLFILCFTLFLASSHAQPQSYVSHAAHAVLALSHSLSHSVIVVHLSRSFSFCFSHFVLLSHSPLFSLLRLTTHNHIHADHHKQIKPNSHIYVFHSAESRFGFSADFGFLADSPIRRDNLA